MNFTFKATKYACYSGYITQAVINNFVPLLFVIFSRQFELSLSQISSLITINFVTQMCVDIFGARYAEHVGYRRVLVTSQLFAATGLLLLGLLPFMISPYPGLVISVIIYAIGSGLTEVMVSPVVEAIPGDAKASSMSLLHSFYCWGQVYTVLISTAYFNIFGLENWRYLSFFFAALPLVTSFFFTKVPINVFGGEGEEKMKISAFLSNKTFWIFTLLMLCSGASELAISQWSSMFAETSLNVSKNTGDLLGPCMFAVCMGIARVGFGAFGERLNLKRSLTLTSLLCVFGYIVATVIPNPYINLAGCGICGFSVGLMWPGTMSLAAKHFPKGGTTLFGLLALSGDIGCSIGPETVGFLSESFSFKTGLLAAAIFPLLMMLLSALLKTRSK